MTNHTDFNYNDGPLQPRPLLPIRDLEVGMHQIEISNGFAYRVTVGSLLIHVVGPPIGGGDSRTIAAAVTRDLARVMDVICDMETRDYMPAHELREAIITMSV